MIIKFFIYSHLEHLFSWLHDVTEDARQYFAICRNCGKNRYSAKACIQARR